jgi:hypothetical protein
MVSPLPEIIMKASSVPFIIAAVVSAIAFGITPMAFVSTVAIGLPAIALSAVARRFVVSA